MPSRALVTLLALACLPAAALAQTRPRSVPIPRALAVQVKADAEDGADIAELRVEEIQAAVTMVPKDLNGDGVPELFVEGTRYCGTNCERWIYRLLPGNRYSLLYHGWGTGETVLPQRINGWPLITEYSHMSCCEGGTHLYRFDGGRYRWRSSVEAATRARGGDSVIYRVALLSAQAGQPETLLMEPVHAGDGLRLAARFDLCRRAGAALCSPPVLRLLSAHLPSGRVCVEVHAVARERRYDLSGNRWCGVTAASGGTERVLELRPSRSDWAALHYGESLEMRGPGLPGEVSLDARAALHVFVTHLADVYSLPPPAQ